MSKESITKKSVPLSTKLVRQSHFFATLPESLVSEMTQYFKAERWDKKVYIDHEMLQHRFFLLLEGRIEIMRTNSETGRTVTLDLLHPGDGFDVITLLDGKVHEVVISPIEELKVISVPIEKMREWIWTYPELNQQFMPYLAEKMKDQENKATDFALHDITTRLSRIILQNLNKAQNYTGLHRHAHTEHLITGLSDDVLARMTGSVRQVINQHLQHWKKEGVIDKKRNQIVVNDLQKIIDDADLTLSRS